MIMSANINLQNTLEKLFTEIIAGFPHLFFLGLKKDNKSSLYTFLVDGDASVTLKEITKLSRMLSAGVDELLPDDDNAFRMEVSTPGADKPLMEARQYPKHIGRTLQVKTEAAQNKGKLVEATAAFVMLEIPAEKKSKDKNPQLVKIPFEDIIEAKIIISFK